MQQNVKQLGLFHGAALLIMLCANTSFGQIAFSGEATAQLYMSNSETINVLRAIPELNTIFGPFNFNMAPIVSATNAESNSDWISHYRFWLRYTTTHWEWKLGLQKINFGPAKLFRPLQWFDSLSPMDPTNLTSGVWALKGRYASNGNTVITMWSLLGNDDFTGVNIFQSNPYVPEVGGRISQPVGPVELGITTHRRQLQNTGSTEKSYESRMGYDGYMECGAGLWFESSISRFTHTLIKKTQNTTIGLDYTFGLGNGLYLAIENSLVQNHWIHSSSKSESYIFMLNYPLNWLNTVSLYQIFLPENNSQITYVNWQHTTDNVMIFVSLFNQSEMTIDTGIFGDGIYQKSNGVRCMIRFNY